MRTKSVSAQGIQADALLAKEGIILTQGGEPTFVPEKTVSPQWNLEALGEQKLSLAWKLCRELQRTLLQGAVILRSNGKHYPGEPIPRWKLTLLRRVGKHPLWTDFKLLTHGEPGKGKPLSPRKFLSALANELGVPGSLRPVYEDVEAAMRSAALRGENTPLPRYSRVKRGFVHPRWTTAQRKFWQKLDRAAGWVIPLTSIEGVWRTDNWVLPDGGELLLLPGTSSIGLRLPLHRLAPGMMSCALTAEIREGALTLFLPPLPNAVAFASLLEAIERTVLALSSPAISLEGYPPPDEEGWESLSVIPDPGVIEVNLPPAADWGSLEKTAIALYAAAEKVGLRGTRIIPSGEVVATGGGGHIVLGGPSMESNPFLLKPQLLPSFLRFIQHHPVLSYLFSGRFIGPSSQAPRIDESSFEVPNELEIALCALERMTSPADPAMIDSILRNLLLDLHGNTHRAEVSVDKFFNPFMPNGRLGLVEFRAIEMTPNAQMFLAIQSLWRALAAAFVTTPYKKPLRDWGGSIHDHYLLPSFLEQDLVEVIGFLRGAGFNFEMEWFFPHLNFRFPILAEASLGDGGWSLRRAAEPWPLLGEQPTPSGGLVRCVDSSTERLEIRLNNCGASTEVTINGFPLPLWPHPGGGHVGAVRFRTTRLPTCLHPQIEPHVPLELQFIPQDGVLRAWNYYPEAVDHGGRMLNLIPMKKSGFIAKKPGTRLFQGSKTLDLLALS